MRPLKPEIPSIQTLVASDAATLLLIGDVIEDLNENAARCLGGARTELIGRRLVELSPVTQSDGRPSAAMLQERVRAARAGLPQSFAWRLAVRDGGAAELLVSLEAVPADVNGRLLARLRDVTALTRTESAVAESERRLRQILDNSPALVYVKDREGRFLFANREFLRLFDLTESVLVGRTDKEVFASELACEYAKNDQRVLETGQPIEFEERARLADGEHAYLSIKFPLYNADGAAYAVCGISTDITPRKRTEEALRQAALGVTGARGAEVFPALVRYLATALDVDFALIALPIPGQPDRMRTIALHARGATAENVEYELKGSPCETVLAQQFRFYPRDTHRLFPGDNMLKAYGVEGYAAVPLFDSLGQPMGLMAALHSQPLADPLIAESMLKIYAVRAAAELERLRSEASYRSIFESSEDAVFVHDWETGAIVDVNPKACTAYGYTREEFKRLNVGDLSSGVHPYTLAEGVKVIERAKRGEAVHLEWQRKNKDGSLHWDDVYVKAAEIAGERRILAFTREITERKRAEEALRASEEQYRSIFNASVDGLALCTPEGRIVDANPAFCRMHGYTREELLATESFQFVHPDSHVRCWAFFEAIAEGKSLSTESKSLRGDGSSFASEVHGVPASYLGQPHLLVIVRDVSERKEREEALKKSESQLRATIEAALDCVIGMDSQGRVIEFNKAAERCFGYKRADILGRPLADHIIPPRLRSAHQRGVELYHETRSGPNIGRRSEIIGMRADGSEFPAEITIGVARGKDEDIFIGYIRDITDRRKAEEQLRLSEERYRLLFEMESDAIVLVDAETLQHLDVNRAACELYGYTREQMLTLRSTDLSAEQEQTRQAMRHGRGSARVPLRYHRKQDGTVFPVEITANFFDLHGRKIMLAAIRDITERKQAEEDRSRLEAQLRQAQKMEAIGHLSGGIAHDFNNILTTVTGYITMAQERPAAAGDEKLTTYLARALRGGGQARDLIQQLLTFSRGQRGTPRPLVLAPILGESIKLLRSTFPSSVEFETALDPRAPAVLLDPIQLEQVLMNLCINARDAMGRVGRLRIALRAAEHARGVCASCRQPVEGTFVELAVSDTGPGMEPAVVDRIFEPFFTTKAPGQGSGMGLATVHGIVHEHGGHLVVETAPGQGSTFRVLFRPIAQEQARREPGEGRSAEASAAAQLAGHVLVVDDEPAVGEFMGELLGSWGLTATLCTRPVEALALFEKQPDNFDLVLTDQTMPKLSGLELVRALHARRPELPVVLYTGYAERLTEEEVRRAGARALVTKPVDTAALRELVKDLLRR